MISISNKQREDIIRYLDMLCDMLDGSSSKGADQKRMIGNLCRAIRSKEEYRK